MELYARRVNHYCRFAVTALPDVRNTKSMTVRQQRTAEGEAILRQLADGDYVTLLDERGEEYRSVEFALWLQKRLNSGVKRLVLVIGGPYGFSDEVYARADGRLSALAHDLLPPDRAGHLRRTDLPGLHHPQQRTLPPRMMQQRPVIAILTANVLVGVGLRSILEKAVPAADVDCSAIFRNLRRPIRSGSSIISSRRSSSRRTTPSSAPAATEPSSSPTDRRPPGCTASTCRPDEERFVHSLMRLQHSVRRPEHALPVQPQAAQPLTEREAEVLTLIAGGLINKQVRRPGWESA